jgi:hypothetical protein
LAFPWFNFDKILYCFGSMSAREFPGSAFGISSDQGKDETTKSCDFSIKTPAINLPKGVGPIKGIEERFEVSAVNGTSSLSIPLPLSHSRQGFQRQLSISYNSGIGNGPFGLGWELNIPSITRQTSKKIPEYKDYDESDVIVLSGAEDIIPKLNNDGSGNWTKIEETKTESGKSYLVTEYMPRVEGLYAIIEKWRKTNSGMIHWRSISHDSVKLFYAHTAESRISDPKEENKISNGYSNTSLMIKELSLSTGDPTPESVSRQLRSGRYGDQPKVDYALNHAQWYIKSKKSTPGVKRKGKQSILVSP